jgi:hypothetical protein
MYTGQWTTGRTALHSGTPYHDEPASVHIQMSRPLYRIVTHAGQLEWMRTGRNKKGRQNIKKSPRLQMNGLEKITDTLIQYFSEGYPAIAVSTDSPITHRVCSFVSFSLFTNDTFLNRLKTLTNINP